MTPRTLKPKKLLQQRSADLLGRNHKFCHFQRKCCAIAVEINIELLTIDRCISFVVKMINIIQLFRCILLICCKFSSSQIYGSMNDGMYNAVEITFQKCIVRFDSPCITQGNILAFSFFRQSM